MKPVATVTSEALLILLDGPRKSAFTYWVLRFLIRRFETENGIKVEESGVNKQIDENAGMTMRGSYSFTEAGVTYTVNWIADENGFQPSGAHLPVAPSV